MSNSRFNLRQLITGNLGTWLLAWFLGVATVLSVIGLLMVSGWFITISAMIGVTGIVISYALASMMIRIFAVGRTLGRYGELVVAHQAIFELLKNLRVQFFEAFAQLHSTTHRNISSSDSQYRLVKDIDTLNEFALKFISPIIVSVFAMSLVFGVIAYWQGAWVWGVLLMLVGLFVVSTCIGARLAKDESKKLQARKAKLQNILPAITQLLIWGQWQPQTKTFEILDNEVIEFYHRQQKLRQTVIVLLSWLMAGMFVLVLYVGFVSLSEQSNIMQLAYLLAMLFGVMGLTEVLMNLFNEPLSYGRSVHAKNRLNELIGQSKELATIKVDDEHQLELLLKNLVTKQPNAITSLTPVDMTVVEGRPMLVRGISGGGKSTLLDTIAGEILPISGVLELKIDGTQYPLEQVNWNGKLGYLGQKVDIFDQTLADNLRLGSANATDEELWQVLDMVGLKDWAMSEPQGLATPLGEYGAAISGGQARRIALARLLLSPKKLLLLDEPFAGLDKVTAQKLWQALKAHQQKGLLVVVTHDVWLTDESDVDTVMMGGEHASSNCLKQSLV